MSAHIRRRTRRDVLAAPGQAPRPRGIRPLRVGLVAPPFIPVPPTTYGGTEGFVDALARGLADEGHEVRLFTIGDSTCPVERSSVYPSAPEPMGVSIYETVHVRAAYEALADCDVIHDNTTVGPVWAAAIHHPAPVVVTCHGDLPPLHAAVYADMARWATLTAISRNQRDSAPDVPFTAVIHHGIDLDTFPVGDGSGGYAMFLGRLAPEKGALDAIEIAQRAGVPLRIAAKMREQGERAYFEQFIEPRLGPGVEFLGEVGADERARQLGGAVALLNPITWAEPFGLVMIEAMACGTPVVSYPNGSAPEVVVDGSTGFLCTDVAQAADALGRAGALDRARCRAHVEAEFSAERMVADYVELYRQVLARRTAGARRRLRGNRPPGRATDDRQPTVSRR